MFSLSTHKNNHNQTLSFHNRQQLVCNKACKYVAEWLSQNKKDCNELLFDQRMISYEKDCFKFGIRAIEQYLRRVHCFELTCNKNKMQISYTGTSQNPKDLMPGDFKIKLRPSW